ncbi:GFA family protein [Aliivibrio fischeri]|uniref:GFA family protein n=1 Tax=Aliivibrio fischeri TaxID=668 RepID=UPI0006D09167|nr:GFA family protein [Aliivibrio fischeri]
MSLKGICLCGEVSFELSGALPPIYQCHCSLCRKVSGSSSNSALIVKADSFKWLSGTNSIGRYVSSSGFKSEFCQCCGSPVPNLSSSKDKYWVPAGLMSEDLETTIKAHVYVNSRANWDEAFICDNVEEFATMPSESEWLKLSDKPYA